MQNMKLLPPRFVKDGPILQNILQGDAIDVLKFPVPRHHELDTARFIGTAAPDADRTSAPLAGGRPVAK